MTASYEEHEKVLRDAVLAWWSEPALNDYAAFVRARAAVEVLDYSAQDKSCSHETRTCYRFRDAKEALDALMTGGTPDA